MPTPAGPPAPAAPLACRYQNFDVEIRRGPGEDYTVVARNAAAGEATETIRFPFDAETLGHRQDKVQIALGRGRTRQVCPDDEKPVRAFGTELYAALFPPAIRGLYEASRTFARKDSMGLRLRLHLENPELAALPWEFLYDPQHGDYICLSRENPLVRYIDMPVEVTPLRMDPPLRILCMVAIPNDLAGLDVKREKDLLTRAIQPLADRGLVELVWSEGQTWRDLQQKMRGGPFHIFHFIGHGGFSPGNDEGFIAFTADNGSTFPLPAQHLARFLRDHSSLRLVVLNSCEGARGSGLDIFSSTSSILIRSGIPAVVAMQYPISDEAAIEFSRSFYESLVTGYPVDASMAEARKAIGSAFPSGVEWGTPVLYMRSPDGMLFEIDRPRPHTEDVRPDIHKDGTGVPPPEPQPVSYPWAFSILGLLCSLGALCILFLTFIMLSSSPTNIPAILSLGLSGLLLLACGISLVFRYPGNAHILLILNFLLALFVMFAFFNPGLWSRNTAEFFAWVVLFLVPGFCVAVFYYPLRLIHK